MSTAEQSLSSLLSNELALIEQLEAVLQQEQACLLSDDVEALQDNTQTKSQLVTKLTIANQQRLAKLAENGQSKDQQSMKNWLEQFADEASKTLWEKLLTITQNTKALNNANGVLLNKLSARTQNALNFLEGHPSHTTTLYGPNGQNAISSFRLNISS